MVLPRNRLHADRIGADAVQRIVEAWLLVRCSADLPKLLKTMATWCRRMPPADEFIEYLDLGRLVVQTVPSMAIIQTELRDAIMKSHKDKPCLGVERPAIIEAKSVTGILMNGMSRFRDLRHQEKLQQVLKGRCQEECKALRHLASMISVTYGADVADQADPSSRSTVQSELQIVPFVGNVAAVEADSDVHDACADLLALVAISPPQFHASP